MGLEFRRKWQKVSDAPHDAGFSLLELVVSLSILALLFSFLPGGVRLGARAWEKSAEIDRLSAVSAAQSFIEQRLSAAVPALETNASGELTIAFTGAEEWISFVGAARNGPAGGAIYKYTIAARPDAQGRRSLIVRHALFDQITSEEGVAAKDVEQVLVPSLGAFSIRYFGRLDEDLPPAWHGTWNRNNALPDLVSINMQGKAGRMSRTQNMIVELKLRPPA